MKYGGSGVADNETTNQANMSTENATETSQASTSTAALASDWQLDGIAPPGKLDVNKGNIAENWKTYKQVQSNYCIVTGLDSRSEECRVALFLHCIGPEALRVYNGLPFPDEAERKKMKSVFGKFDEKTVGEVNETYEQYVFNSRNQGENGSIDVYVTELQTLAKTCGFVNV